MATQNPISTISYNTEAFLRERLEAWLSAHIIQAYQYIYHKGEDGDKDHIHLRIEPNKRIDPMDLSDQLKEYQMGKDKPLGCRTWRPSKEEDWCLYAVHHKPYLDLKYNGGEKGEKLPYEWTAIQANESYDTEVMWVRALASMRHSTVNMANQLQQGMNPMELIMQGENVFVVNAIAKATYTNDYQRLHDDYNALYVKYQKLLAAVDAAHYSVEIDPDENYRLISFDQDPD